LSRNPDSESDDSEIEQLVEGNLELFDHPEKYVKKEGIYYIDGDESRPHPLQVNVLKQRKRRAEMGNDEFLLSMQINHGMSTDRFSTLLKQGRTERIHNTRVVRMDSQ